jgi:hypothetical protein
MIDLELGGRRKSDGISRRRPDGTVPALESSGGFYATTIQ